MSSDPTNKLVPVHTAADLAAFNGEEEQKAFRRHLIALRAAFQDNQAVRECLTAQTREERKQGVLHFVGAMALASPGGMPLLERAVDYLLAELEQMMTAGHSRYIVDESTGMAVAPLTAELVQKTPDFIDDGGNLRKGRHIVDPGFASALGLAKQEQERKKTALEKAKEPGFAQVYEHVHNPDSILQVAREHLESAGVASQCVGDVSEIMLKVGVEQSDGVFQAPNRGFHRHAIYGAQVARRIVTEGYKACELMGLEKKSDSKHRWYEVKALVPAQTPDPTPATP